MYSIQALTMDEQIPDEVTNAAITLGEEEHTSIMVNKTKTFSNVLHSLGLMRYEHFELSFLSVEKAVQVVPLPSSMASNGQIEDSDISYKVSVIYK